MGSFENVREDAIEVNWQRYARLWVECPYIPILIVRVALCCMY